MCHICCKQHPQTYFVYRSYLAPLRCFLVLFHQYVYRLLFHHYSKHQSESQPHKFHAHLEDQKYNHYYRCHVGSSVDSCGNLSYHNKTNYHYYAYHQSVYCSQSRFPDYLSHLLAKQYLLIVPMFQEQLL